MMRVRTNTGRGSVRREGSAIWFLGLLPLMACAVPESVHAQDRWTLDVRIGAAVPTEEVQGHDLGTGLGLRATLGYGLFLQTAAYVDWDWHRFSPGESFAGANVNFEESGSALGLGFEHPFSGDSGDGPAIRLRAGITYSHIELEDAEGNLVANSGHGIGWETGAACVFRITDRVRMAPGIRYRALSRPMTIEGTRTDVDLRYVSLDLGFSVGF